MPRPLARRDALRKVKYGRSDMVVSELCAGSMTWGSFAAVKRARSSTVSWSTANFDTAEMYPSRSTTANHERGRQLARP